MSTNDKSSSTGDLNVSYMKTFEQPPEKKGLTAYLEPVRTFVKIFRAMGGFFELAKSAYLHFALFLLIPTWSLWKAPTWWEMPIATLPTLLGFSLSAYALFMALGGKSLVATMTLQLTGEKKQTLFDQASAVFAMVILLQCSAFLIALIGKAASVHVAWMDPFREQLTIANLVGGGIGFLLFIGAVLSCARIAQLLFLIGNLFQVTTHHQLAEEGRLPAEIVEALYPDEPPVEQSALPTDASTGPAKDGGSPVPPLSPSP